MFGKLLYLYINYFFLLIYLEILVISKVKLLYKLL